MVCCSWFRPRRLESTEYGIQYDVVAKQLGNVKGEGLYTGPPGFKFIKFPAVFRTENLALTCVTQDGLPVQIQSSYQFVVNRTMMKEVVHKYRNYDTWKLVVRAAAASAVHHGCSEFKVQDYQSRRQDVQARQFAIAKERFQQIYAVIADMQLKNVNPPEAWTSAVESKEKAREDIELALNERAQRYIAATTSLGVVGEQAKKTVANAVREAEVTLTRSRAEAQTILLQYETEANVTADVQKNLNLTTQGVLAYLMNRVLEKRSSLDVAMDHPAKSTYSDEL